MPQSLSALHVHIVFSTKDRVPFLTSESLPTAHAYIARILQNLGCEQPIVGGVADHVHIICNMPRTVSAADLLMTTKKDSSKFIKTLHGSMRDFHWQSGYGIFAVSADHLPMVREYVRSQEMHHKVETFQDEFRRLLREAGLDFDEKYVWD